MSITLALIAGVALGWLTKVPFLIKWYREFQATTQALILYAENELDTLEDRTYRLISDAQKEGVIITITVPVPCSTNGPLIMQASFVRVTR